MSNRIKDIRKQQKMTQDELALMVGTSKQNIWFLENGYRKLNQVWLIKISKALNCSISDLLPKSEADIIKAKEDEFTDLSEEEKNLIRTFRKVKETSENKENTKVS